MADIEKVDGWSVLTSTAIAVWDWLEKLVSAFWVGLEWPHAVLAIFCLTVIFFRKELREFIPRITEVGASGVRLSDAIVQNQQKTSEEPVVVPMPEGAINLGAEFPKLMEITTGSVDLELEKLKDADKQIYFLRTYLSYWRAMYIFENFYSTIFGGQIKILQFLNNFGSVGCSKDLVRNVWDDHVLANRPLMDTWQFETYLKFVYDHGLAEDRSEFVVITELGKEFLIWMTKYGKLVNKPL